ncbi:hypothetical protein BJ508DRAFT_132911 [Ascobolus immersus RN42]|uniref:F-box domain-containing protein n=1 Tax=Ascobolus immersus RN42 TaxID=1160509 RepID=A0A3N4I1J2_ASCIM|nr:hypothetical protein BJ508DRAFT_132911 [Ascobolus immersus RN42]
MTGYFKKDICHESADSPPSCREDFRNVLPNELCNLIFSELSKKDLVTLTRVSTSWCQHIKSFCFHTPTFGTIYRQSNINFDKWKYFCKEARTDSYHPNLDGIENLDHPNWIRLVRNYNYEYSSYCRIATERYVVELFDSTYKRTQRCISSDDTDVRQPIRWHSVQVLRKLLNGSTKVAYIHLEYDLLGQIGALRPTNHSRSSRFRTFNELRNLELVEVKDKEDTVVLKARWNFSEPTGLFQTRFAPYRMVREHEQWEQCAMVYLDLKTKKVGKFEALPAQKRHRPFHAGFGFERSEPSWDTDRGTRIRRYAMPFLGGLRFILTTAPFDHDDEVSGEFGMEYTVTDTLINGAPNMAHNLNLNIAETVPAPMGKEVFRGRLRMTHRSWLEAMTEDTVLFGEKQSCKQSDGRFAEVVRFYYTIKAKGRGCRKFSVPQAGLSGALGLEADWKMVEDDVQPVVWVADIVLTTTPEAAIRASTESPVSSMKFQVFPSHVELYPKLTLPCQTLPQLQQPAVRIEYYHYILDPIRRLLSLGLGFGFGPPASVGGIGLHSRGTTVYHHRLDLDSSVSSGQRGTTFSTQKNSDPMFSVRKLDLEEFKSWTPISMQQRQITAHTATHPALEVKELRNGFVSHGSRMWNLDLPRASNVDVQSNS